MLNKLSKTVLSALIMLLAVSSSAMPVFALTSDLQYDFATENEEEFYNRGETNINYNGAVPDYLHDIYDLTPQTVYDSEYSATIITPESLAQTPITNSPTNAPIGNYSTAPAQTTGTAQGTGTTGESVAASDPNMNIASYPDYYNEETPQYPITTIEEVRGNDGSIGTLKIPKIGLSVTAYDGDTYAAMAKGIGHISSTSCWNSTVGLVGHNRGANDYFGKLKNLKPGDEMTYSTKLGTRTYTVHEVVRISETDWSKLQYTSDNRLVLLTCVEDVPSQRLAVICVEKR
jgi:LPXTG-site transpeptidase (sortase) family protein